MQLPKMEKEYVIPSSLQYNTSLHVEDDSVTEHF